MFNINIENFPCYVSEPSLTVPLTVSNLAITHITTNSLSLKWDHPAGENTLFAVTYSGSGTMGVEETVSATTRITRYELRDLLPNTEYTVAVTGVVTAMPRERRSEPVTLTKYTGKIFNRVSY